MTFTIGIAGKGGVGKTTVAATIITSLVRRGTSPVLAVDADPNLCLDESLGVKVVKSVGTVREEARELAGKGGDSGIGKQALMTLKIAESLVEADDFDLIAMGRPEGPGCYCYANNVLKQIITQISDSYPYVVIDNEAGLENLSRRLVSRLDLLVMVADPSKRGLNTVRRLAALADEMKIDYSALALIVNRLRHDTLTSDTTRLGREIGADFLIGLPDDDLVAELGEHGKNLALLPETNVVRRRIQGLLDDLLPNPAN